MSESRHYPAFMQHAVLELIYIEFVPGPRGRRKVATLMALMGIVLVFSEHGPGPDSGYNVGLAYFYLLARQLTRLP
jgi:hypothetical protein